MNVKRQSIPRRRAMLAIALMTLTGAFFNASADGAEPGWSPVIIATGDYRQKIESTPIEQRPYRPLHIYGNTVRRNYYRGTRIPTPRAEIRAITRSPMFGR